MKKAIAFSLALLALTGCGNKATKTIETESAVESVVYFQYGRYHINADLQGQVLTEDGNIWGYTQDVISDNPAYHNEPVVAVFDDNGTPDDIYDDIILGLMLDRETAIYDKLEMAFSENGNFTVERDGNNIRIGVLK